MDLIDLYDSWREAPEFRHMARPFTYFIPGHGAEKPKVMLLGEVPGSLDNVRRRAISGAPGRALHQLTKLARISDRDVFVTNTIKYQPEGNRQPTKEEVEASRLWVLKEWRVLGRPPVIVTLGAIPLACLAPKLLPVSSCAGKPAVIPRSNNTVLWPMFHPAYALNYPSIRPIVEDHWEALGRWLREEGLL